MADDTPVERSSHPRGFASGAPLPPMSAAASDGTHFGNAAATQVGSTAVARQPHGGQQTATSGGVNISGATRVDARAQSGMAAAVGQQNTAGNRVGSIGGSK